MKKFLVGLGIGLVGIGLIAAGVLVAGWFWNGHPQFQSGRFGMPMMRSYTGSAMMGKLLNRSDNARAPYGCRQNTNNRSFYGRMMENFRSGGMMQNGVFGGMMGNGSYGPMMGGYRLPDQRNNSNTCPFLSPSGSPVDVDRLTLDQAQISLEQYLSDQPNLELAEIMEFENNFYGVVLEKDSGRGAMELLVDPYTGSVYPEHGPNMMWNEKYGHMGSWYATEGVEMSRDEATLLAQTYLDSQQSGAQVEGMGIDFYGYFTFDYTKEGEVAGMLSVHKNGDTWIHDWHGSYISEVELN